MISQRSLVESAVEEIKERIADGSLAAGERILEIRLSEALGISRPPLREALRILAGQHLLELSPRRGYRVIGLSERDISEIYGLRTALERYALDLIMQRDDPPDFSSLRSTVDAMWQSAERGDARAVIRSNQDFHAAFVRLAGNARLEQAYATLLDQMVLYMIRNISQEADRAGGLEDGCRRHEELLDVLRSSDRAAIDEALREHGERRYLFAEPSAAVRSCAD